MSCSGAHVFCYDAFSSLPGAWCFTVLTRISVSFRVRHELKNNREDAEPLNLALFRVKASNEETGSGEDSRDPCLSLPGTHPHSHQDPARCWIGAQAGPELS